MLQYGGRHLYIIQYGGRSSVLVCMSTLATQLGRKWDLFPLHIHLWASEFYAVKLITWGREQYGKLLLLHESVWCACMVNGDGGSFYLTHDSNWVTHT